MSMFCQRMDKSESGGRGGRIPSMKVVTSGAAYLDIDAYACCIAYAELLNHQGVEARAVSSAPLNASIPGTVLGWQSALDDYLLTGRALRLLRFCPLYRGFRARTSNEKTVEQLIDLLKLLTDRDGVIELQKCGVFRGFFK